MERNKKTPLLFLLLALLHVCTVRTDTQDCPSLPDKNLTCYNDYNRNITCVWNSAYDHRDAVCTLWAKRLTENSKRTYSASCDLESVNTSRPALKRCSLYFNKDGIFQSFHELSINLICKPGDQILKISYKPVCHIKLDPPAKPDINLTTISWLSQFTLTRFTSYDYQLQWKKDDQTWSDPSVQIKPITCDKQCVTELYPDSFIQRKTYEARVRVKATDHWARSTWSDWSPTASWVSPVGRSKPTLQQKLGVSGRLLGMIIAGAVFALFLAVIFLRNDKATWVYRKIKCRPLPDPGKSFLKDVNFQNWLSPHFTSNIFHSPLKSEEIISVEVTSTVDAVILSKKEKVLEKMRNESSHGSNSSSFYNPSYSHLCAPPASSSTTGNSQPSATDTPDRSVGSQADDKTTEEDREEERKKELLSKGNNNSEPVQVISDYERVEKLQAERVRLQSLDSGMCSGEEVSQDSLEAESITVTDSHEEGSEGKGEERKGGNGKVDFQMLFGGSGSVFGKGSIQVCSDYEQVQKLIPGSPEHPSLDSGVCSGGEEQVSHEESLEDFEKSNESTSFQFTPPLPCTSLSPLPCFSKLPLKIYGADLNPTLQPLGPGHVLERISLMSMSMSMAPSGDGYMPVREEWS